jgi:hypothetical protein
VLAGDCPAQTDEPGPVRVGPVVYDLVDAATGDLRLSSTVVVTEINSKEITTRVSARGRIGRSRSFMTSIEA